MLKDLASQASSGLPFMNQSRNSQSELLAIIRKRISGEGKLSFRDFMELALYHPEHGYYCSANDRIGWEGDFYTSPDVHAVFGLSIMKQLVEMRDLLGAGERFTVIEPGAGKGTLCTQVLNAARERAPSLFEALRYIIIEKSAPMRELQRKTFESTPLEEKVAWCDDIRSALKGTDAAVIISNEFFDALPVHRVRRHKGEWLEVFVTARGNELCEETAPLSSDDLSQALSRLGSDFDEGYTTEINLDAVNLIREIGSHLAGGFVVTIDYGYPRADYYSPERTEGTLLCYHRHTTNDNPYRNIGHQDLTAHVDFTSLAEAGNKSGLLLTGYCDQLHFLIGLGLVEELERLENSDLDAATLIQHKQAIKSLFMPDSMGSVFKVLIQHKGMNKPALKAFSFKDLSHRLFV